MAHCFPYQAKALMRFKAQDGQFILATNQIVTVTGTTDDDGDWLDVADQEGGSGSVPAGFLVHVEPDPHQQTQQPPAPAVPQEQSPAPPGSSNDPSEPVKASSHPAEISAPIAKPSSDHLTTHKPIPVSSSHAATSPPDSKTTPLASAASNDPPPTSHPPVTPAKAPPPPAAKPNALRDRIAMFNKPAPAASSPPPNTRPKPPIARKPLNIPPPAPPIEAAHNSPTITPASHQDECARSTEPSGMSAADAEESVKAGGSLKDRIRLLQQQQQQQATASESSSPAPKPKREWKRPPPAPTDELNPIPAGLPPAPPESPGAGAERIVDPDTEALPDSTEVDPAAAEVPEDEDEVARRQRIAERMAKLGGAKMGFGLPGLLPKPSLPQQSSEGSSQAAEEPPAEELPALPPERIVMPTIPRRAAPPRRKAPAPSASPSAVETPIEDQPNQVTRPDEQAHPLLEDSLPQEKHTAELRPVHDASALATEPSSHNAPQSSDPEPALPPSQGRSVQSQEGSTSDQLSGQPAQDSEHDPIAAEKDPLENDSAYDHPLHQENDPSNEPAQVARQNTIGSSSSIEPNLPPHLSHEPDQPDGVFGHQLAVEDEALARPSVDQVAQSIEETPRTSVLSSLEQHEEERASSRPHHTPNSVLDPEEQLHGSIGNPVSSAGPPSRPIVNPHEEDIPAEPPLSPALTHKTSEPGTQSHELNPEADPGPTAYQSDSVPLSAEPAFFASSSPAPESSITNSNAHCTDDVDEVAAEAPAPHPLDTQSAEKQVIAEPTPVQAAPATIPEADSTGEAIERGVAECMPTEDEDEEVARRRRITARLAKMGGRSMMAGTSPRRPLPEPPVARNTPITQAENSDTIEPSENLPETGTADTQSESLPVDINEGDDDDAARRRRIAERMAKMGGRSMMGGMTPMLSQQSAGSAASASQTASTTSVAQPTRALPPAVQPQKSSSTDSYSALSPPQRAAPMPTFPDHTDRQESPPIPPNRPRIPTTAVNLPKSSSTDSYSAASPALRAAPVPTFTDTDRPQDSPPIPPNRPEGTHSACSPAAASPHRPRIPNAYSSPQHSSILSQGVLARSADDQLPSPAEALPDTFHGALSENAELLSKTPPQRSAPQLPAASPSAFGIPDDSAVPDGFRLRRHDEPEPQTDVDPTLDSQRMNAGLPDGLELDKTVEARPPVPAQQQQQQSRVSSFKARDLDIASERWWRSRPVAPPSSVTSLDDVLIRLQGTSSLNKGIAVSQYELIVIMDDYSKTVVSVKFGAHPEDESSTELTQSHYPPPEPYDISQLQALSHSLGPQIVSRAKAKEDEKGFKGAEGSSFVKTIIQSLGNALEPVGATFGQVIYHCDVIHDSKGSQPEIHIKDDIRPGDIVASYGASFKGKGIGHNSMVLGSLNTPHAGVVSENDIKKNKFKAFGVFNGKVELLPYRLDELKSGSIVVYRVLDKAFLE